MLPPINILEFHLKTIQCCYIIYLLAKLGPSLKTRGLKFYIPYIHHVGTLSLVILIIFGALVSSLGSSPS